MKTIHDIELIEKIQRNPKRRIGQRNYSYFQAYTLAFLLLRKIENLPELEKQYAKLPSIDEFMEKKYNISLGSRSWTSPLEYYCEDQSELFEEAIKHIYEYESMFPFSSKLLPIYSSTKKYEGLDLLNFLGSLGYKPQMYFGSSSLACLRAFIKGYFDCKKQYKLNVSEFENKTMSFIKRYQVRKIYRNDFATWDRKFAWEWGFSIMDGNEKYAIPKFLHLLEQFAKVKINPLTEPPLEINWEDYNPWKPKV